MSTSSSLLILIVVCPLLICGCAPNSTGNSVAKAVMGTALQAVGLDVVGAGLLVGTMENVNRSLYIDRAMNDVAVARAAAESEAIVPRKGGAIEAQLKQMFPTTTIPVNTSTADPIPMKESGK
ncbi:hypothetical protein LGN19_33990 [Burkholderia sp. AU30198]|uniref:hypothetical protein n=1 Tax=Burkholderia sp. AU30198 TaxID=2879627 RepID=UPI001CF59465|nr:hypothetical protein [Burkholderia sp. AU30198]MCA8298809.1 hypothetical protein [Burkholderia sp. AU30198]